MRTLRPILTAALTLAAAGALLTGGATAATAATTWDHHWHWGSDGVWVKERGDVIRLCDVKRDGNPAWIIVLPAKGDYYQIYVNGGYGHCVTRRASQGGKYNLREGVTVRVRFWNYNTGRVYGYKKFLNDH
ncbi:MAG TPA: hypothetical protein VGL93_16380 [Streptosporangiaceae bacterium]